MKNISKLLISIFSPVYRMNELKKKKNLEYSFGKISRTCLTTFIFFKTVVENSALDFD